MKLSEIKRKFKDRWVLLNVSKENMFNQPVEGDVIAHAKHKGTIYNRIKKLPKGFRIATLFTGRPSAKHGLF